jgi:hypothetical protein
MRLIALLAVLCLITFAAGCVKIVRYPVSLDKDGNIGYVEYTNIGFDVMADDVHLITPSGVEVKMTGYNSRATMAELMAEALVARAKLAAKAVAP